MGRNIVWSSTRIHFGNFIFWKFMYDLFAILKEINFAVAMLWQYTFYIWSYSWKYSKLCSPSTFKLFSNSQMNLILENCHLSINVNRPSTITIGEHITSLLNLVLATILKRLLKLVRMSYMHISNRKLLINASFQMHFSYCPLVRRLLWIY